MDSIPNTFSSADVGFKNDFLSTHLVAGFNQCPGYDLDPDNLQTTGNQFLDTNLGTNFTFNPDGSLRIKAGLFYLDRDQGGADELQTGVIFDRTNKIREFQGLGGVEYLYGNRNRLSFMGNYAVWENQFQRDQRHSDELDAKELNKEISSLGTLQWDHEGK